MFSAFGRALSAQAGTARLSVDGAVGVGPALGGGERIDRGLFAADLLVAIRLSSDSHNASPVGFEVSRYRQVGGDAICVLRTAHPDSGCIPKYPSFNGLNVVVGHQWGAFRVFGGPGYYTGFGANTPTTHSFGVGVRTDLAVHLDQLVAATVAARGAWIPNVRGQSFVPGSVMVGLRLEIGS